MWLGELSKDLSEYTQTQGSAGEQGAVGGEAEPEGRASLLD